MTKNSLVRQFEIFSMASWAVAYTWGHTPYDIRICPHSLQTAKPHYVECSARSLHNLRLVEARQRILEIDKEEAAAAKLWLVK